MIRRVTDGASSASPAATTRTASTSSSGGAFLSRKPLAPARSASKTYSSRSKVVRIDDPARGSPASCTIRRVASSPSMPGIWMSISTTSGRSRRVTVDGLLAVARPRRRPSMSSSVSRIMRNPARTIAWSSASTHADRHAARRQREGGAHGEAAVRARARRAAGRRAGSPLAHADQPVAAAVPAGGRGASAAVVDDLDLELVRPVAHAHVGGRRRRRA